MIPTYIKPQNTSRRWTLLFALCLIVALYSWTPKSYHSNFVSDNPVGFYNELADAFLSGQLYLKRSPEPALISLPDPFDPIQNSPYRINDLSYFKKRYYLYLGAAPCIAVFIPFRLLTGKYLTQLTATTALCALGSFFGVAFLLYLKQSWASSCPPLILLSSITVMIFASGFYVIAGGSLAQHVAIASAFAFLMLCYWTLAHAINGQRLTKFWFACSSFTMGAAIASRPNYVFASLALVPLFIFFRRRSIGHFDNREHLLQIAALATPLVSVVSLLLLYNYNRFHNPLEFGQHLVLGAWDQRNMPNSDTAPVFTNIWKYFFSPGIYSSYFPFLKVPSWAAIGVITNVPWLWFAPLAAWFIMMKGINPELRILGIALLTVAGCNILTLVFLPSGNPHAVMTSANQRYLLDFLPTLSLFTSLGLITGGESVTGRWRRLSFLLLVLFLSLVSAIGALSLDLQRFPYDSFRPLSKALNIPSFLVGKLRGETYGALDITLRFPKDRPNGFEPLVETGSAGSADLIYVNYVYPDQIRFGFVGTEYNGPLSKTFPINYLMPHTVNITMGSLYPPDGHPDWGQLDDRQVATLERTLNVTLDGSAVLDRQVPFHQAKPSSVLIGRNTFLQSYSEPSFTGDLISVSRAPIQSIGKATNEPPKYGAIRLELRFPRDFTPGTTEPLVVTGVARASDLAFVEYLNDHQLRMAIDHWGSATLTSLPLSIDYSISHTVEISMGSLYFRDAPARLRDKARVILDGKLVLDAELQGYESSPFDVVIGTNPVGGSVCGFLFTGTISNISRIDYPR